MKAVYSPSQASHRPDYGFTRGRRIPYADEPKRAVSIATALDAAGIELREPDTFDTRAPGAVHAEDYLNWLAGAYEAWLEAGRPAEGVIPDVFPIRPAGGKPTEPSRLAGWYCFDSETPVTAGTWPAAVDSANCALTAAELVHSGERAAYALCRPPGHHAGRDFCGGYCYLNNAALAARRLSEAVGRVAVLDIDYHHGNGTQDIFRRSAEVLYVSVHADPNRAYPYFWGYPEETGTGEGRGRNLNLPLPVGCNQAEWLDALSRAVEAVADFSPAALVVSLGTDVAAGDRLGNFGVRPETFARAAEHVAALGLPAAIVQEGGYDVERMGRCVVEFLRAL